MAEKEDGLVLVSTNDNESITSLYSTEHPSLSTVCEERPSLDLVGKVVVAVVAMVGRSLCCIAT